MELPVSIILIIVQVVLGLILLFRGNKSVRLVLGILGFVGGVSIANFLVVYFALEDFWIWLLPLMLGVVGAWLMSTILSGAFFMAGAVIGWKVAEYALGIFGIALEPFPAFLVLLTSAIIFGIIMNSWQDQFIIIATAFFGATLVVDGAVAGYHLYSTGSVSDVQIFSSSFNTTEDLVLLLIVVLVAIIGGMYQRKRN